MKTLTPIYAMIVLTSAVASAQSAPALSPQSSVDDVLESLHDRGVAMKTLHATLVIEETDAIVEDTTRQQGTLELARADDDAKLRISLTKPDVTTYVLNGEWLTEKNDTTRSFVRYQVREPGQKIDLFKVGQGPFPLPLGQTPESVKEAFDVKPAGKLDSHWEGLVAIELKPKENSNLADKYDSIVIGVDPADGLPKRIQSLDRNLTRFTTAILSDVKLDAPIPAERFTLPDPPATEEWKRVTQKLGE